MSGSASLFRRYPNRVFVETGTYLGDGIQDALDAGFTQVHSIELSPQLHADAQRRFAGDPRVHLHLGDSGAALGPLIATLSGPITFWLDGHYSEGNTARGDQNTPLERELAAIAAHPHHDHSLLIDDVRCFGTEHFDGLALDTALDAVRRINPDYVIGYEDGHVPNDVLTAAPPASRRGPRKLRILHAVEFYDPSVGGAQAVVREVSERLAARGHDVTVATTNLPQRTRFEVNGVRIAGFEVSGNLVNGLRGDLDTYQRFLADGDFDVMMAYAAQQWTVDAAWGLFDRVPYATVLAPCGFSGLRDPQYANYFKRLPRLMRRLDRLIFHSDTYQDRAFANSHGLQDLSVTVPNAASGESFPPPDPEADAATAAAFRQRHGIPPTGPLLLTVGTHTGLKGHACTLKAFRQLKARAAHLLIVGNGTPGTGCWNACHRGVRRASRGGKTARTLDLPRDEVIAAFRAADVFVFPSRVECSPLVLFECLAAGLPFVAGPAGNSAEIADWSGAGDMVPATDHHGLLTIKPRDLAARVDALLDDAPRRAAMAAAGRAAFDTRFDWERATDAYEAAYRDAIVHHAARTD